MIKKINIFYIYLNYKNLKNKYKSKINKISHSFI